MINIVLFGPPGAGKGTQADLLKEKYGLNHISTGEVIRDEIRRGTPRGLAVKEVIESGKLASDEMVLGIIGEYVGKTYLEAKRRPRYLVAERTQRDAGDASGHRSTQNA